MLAPARKIDSLLAEWVLERLAPEDVPDLAIAALGGGCESSTVAVLAGLQRPTRTEVEAELGPLLSDVGVARPSRLEALKTLVDERVARIAAGALEPAAGAEQIRELWAGFDADRHPETWIDVSAFVRVAGGSAEDAPAGAAAGAELVTAARTLQARGGLNIGAGLVAGQLDGRVLLGCSVQEHVLDGTRTVVRLALEFAGGLLVTFGSAADGRSLQLGSRPLRSHDLGEHGRVEVREAGYPADVLRPGIPIQAVTVLSDRHGIPVAARIETAAATVHVYKREDNLAIDRELPQDVRTQLADRRG